MGWDGGISHGSLVSGQLPDFCLGVAAHFVWMLIDVDRPWRVHVSAANQITVHHLGLLKKSASEQFAG